MRRSHEGPPRAPGAGLTLWRRVEQGFDAAFGAPANPLRHLGALAFLSFWLLAASGTVRVSGAPTSR